MDFKKNMTLELADFFLFPQHCVILYRMMCHCYRSCIYLYLYHLDVYKAFCVIEEEGIFLHIGA